MWNSNGSRGNDWLDLDVVNFLDEEFEQGRIRAYTTEAKHWIL